MADDDEAATAATAPTTATTASTTAARTGPRVLVGYDGSPESAAAIQVAARIWPRASAQVVHLWQPPFASPALGRRLWQQAESAEQFTERVELEGRDEAEQVAALGVLIAHAAGWEAEPLVQRSYGGDGYTFAGLAQRLGVDVVVLGSRGLSRTDSLLGSTTDLVVNVSPVPVLVVPSPMTKGEREAASSGPVVLGLDGSSGSLHALTAAQRLLSERELVLATVETDGGEDPPSWSARPDDAAPEVVHLEHRGHGDRGVAADLLAEADRRDAAVLVLGSRGRSLVEEVFLGSVATTVLHRSTRPVLVVTG